MKRIGIVFFIISGLQARVGCMECNYMKHKKSGYHYVSCHCPCERYGNGDCPRCGHKSTPSTDFKVNVRSK